MLKPQTPAINWNHPLTKGLVFDMPFFEGGGLTALDVATKTTAALTSGISWTNSLLGKGINFTSSSTKKAAFTARTPVNNLVRQTVQIIFASPAAWTDAQQLYIKGQDGNSRYFQTGEVSTSLSQFVIVAARATQNGVWGFNLPSLNAIHNHVITYDNSSTSNVPIPYMDSVPQGLTTYLGGTGAMIADTTDLTIGGGFSASTSYKSDIYLVRVWDTILNIQQIKQLYQDPFQTYAKPRFFSVLNTLSAASYQATLMMMGQGM